MNYSMKKILFSNNRKMVIEEGSLTNPDNVLLALTVNKRLESYGVTLDASAIRALSTQTAEEMAKTCKEIESIIREVIGANDFNGQLFYANFPEEVMDKDSAELYLNSLFYYAFAQTNDKLSLAIADELHSHMTDAEHERLPLLEQFPRELKIINKGTENDLFKMMDARIHSLNMSESQFEELKSFANVYRKEFNSMLASETPFQSKETKVKIAMMLHDSHRDGELSLFLRDSVDVLRFAAMLSKNNGVHQNNVELQKAPYGPDIAFKLKNREKILIRGLLNQCEGLYTDIWRQEKLFKSLMNRLGTTEKDGCPARVVKAFDNLAKNRKLDEHDRPIYNANKLIPEAVKHLNDTGDVSKLEKIASERPGDFLRAYLSSVVHTAPQYRDAAINVVRHCIDSDSIPLKTLLTVREQLALQQKANQMIAENREPVKVYKHHGKHYATVNKGVNLSNDEIEHMRDVLKETAAQMVNGYQELGKVYIDPKLADVKAPGREMRDASGGSVLTPYSTINMDENKNLLMFGIRWEKVPGNDNAHIDVDLSVHMYDGNYKNVGHVSYSNLRNNCAVHSGDYVHVSASGSSTEAIAVDKERLRENNIRYLVAEVHCFSIKSFRDAGNCRFVYEQKEGSFNQHGYQAYRDSDKIIHNQRFNEANDGKVCFLGKVFEPSQLENCITLNSDGTTTVPLVYDVEADKVIWLDMTLNNSNLHMLRNTENPLIMGSVMAEIERAQNNPYPSIKDVVECYAMHNGELTDNIQEADTVFTRENVDAEKLGIKEEARVITGFDLDILSKEFSGNDDQSMIVKEEPTQTVQENEQVVVEHPLLKQLRYLHQKLDMFPNGATLQQELTNDEITFDGR